MTPVGKFFIGRLSRRFDLSLVRARSVFRAGLFYFAFVAGVTTYKSATNALFLARRDPTDLPYLYLATAVAITIVTAYIGNLLTHTASKPILRSGVTLAAALVAGLSVLAAIDFRPSLAALYVAGEVYATALSVLFWARLGEIFDIRVAKRVFGTIAAAGMAGAVLGGLAVRLCAGFVPAPAWCFFAALTLIGVRQLLGAERGRGQIHRRKISFREGLAYATVDRFPRGVAILVLLLAVQTATVDYAFRTGAVISERGNEAGMTALFGTLNAVVGVAAIVFQVFITGPLLRRLGVFVFLSFIPVASIFTASWALVVPTMFIPLFLLKTFEMMGSLSLYQPGLQLLYNPMPTVMRDSVRALVDGAVKKVGGAVGGIVLLLVGATLGPRLLLAGVVLFAAILLLWIRTLRRGYLDALEAKLGRRLGASPGIDARDRSTREKLFEALSDPDPGKVLAALAVLARERRTDLHAHVPSLIAHPNEAVRVRAIAFIEESPDPSFAPLLIRIIEGDERRPKAHAARALELVDPAAARRVLLPVLEAPAGTHELPLVCAALKALLSADDAEESEGAAGAHLAERALEELFARGRGASPAERRELARLFGHLGPGPYAVRLSTYLDDPEVSVQRLAIQSAGVARHPTLVPKLIAKLTDRHVRRLVIEALAEYGDEIVPVLAQTQDDRRLPVDLRVHVPKVLRLIGTADAGAAMLFSNVNDDAFLRHVIVLELSRLRREHPEVRFDPVRTNQAAVRRLRAYQHYRPFTMDLSTGGPAYAVLQRAVDDRVEQNLQAALRILGLVYDGVALENALRGFGRGNHADAVELVDVALQGNENRAEILRALETDAPTGLPGMARERAYVLVEGRDVQLAMIAWETLKRLGEDPPDVREPTEGEPLMPKSIIDRVFVLEGVQLFHGLSVDDLAAVAAIVTEGHAGPAEMIYREGDSGQSMYIIVSGEVRLLRRGEPLLDLTSGDSFGQVSILDGGARPVTAVAGDDGVDYLYLEREPFMDLVADRPEVVNGLFEVLARRIRELVELTGQGQGPGARDQATVRPGAGPTG